MCRILLIACASSVLLAGCGKKESAAAPPATAANATAADATAADATAASSTPASNAPTTAPADAAADPEAAEKQRKIDFALSEEKLANDPKGQWAVNATASTSYQGAKDTAPYSASQVTGAPNVLRYGDDGNAWAPKDADAGIEWLQVGFANPVHATGIRVRQNSSGGGIIKLELIDDQDGKHAVFEGADAGKYDEYHWWFVRQFDKTPYLVKGAKLTLATNAVSGWDEIDAVQLLRE